MLDVPKKENVANMGSKLYKNLEKICIVLIIMLQGWVYLIVPTSNNGDATEYIKIALELFETDSEFKFLRLFGYPLLLKVFSVNLEFINLFFFFQSIFFVFTVIFFANKVCKNEKIRFIIYAPALVPSIAYMQKIIFPDGIITSLILLLFALILDKKLIKAFVVSLVLVTVKLVFVFLLVYVMLCILYEKKQAVKTRLSLIVIYFCFIFCLLPAIYIIKPFPLYQTIVQVPSSFDNTASPVRTPTILEFTCGGVFQEVTDPSLLEKITWHSASEFYMPFGPDFAAERNCSKEDMRNLQRQLIRHYLREAPEQQALKFLNHFSRSFFVLAQNYHLDYMLLLKLRLLKDHYAWNTDYLESQVKNFKRYYIDPPRQPSYYLFDTLYNLNKKMLLFLSIASGFVVICFVFTMARMKKPDEKMLHIVAFLLSYNFIITAFAFLYDRYLYVNFFMWMALGCLIVARSVEKKSLEKIKN